MSPSPDASARRSGGDLADYASLLRRGWPIVVFFLVAGTGAGAALLRVTPPAYTASAQVLVTATGLQEQTNQITNRQREPLNLDTEAQIARSAVVAGKAGLALKTTPGPVEISVPPNTSVLEISYTAADPHAAAAGAGAYAQAYLANRRETTAQALNVQLKALLVKLRQVNASLATVVATLPGLGKGTAERTLALQRQNVLARQVYNLTVKYDALRTVAVTPGSVISDAVAPAGPSMPSVPLYLGSGLMAGLLTGVGLAWLRDRLSGLRERPGTRVVTGLSALDGAVVGIPGGHRIDDLAVKEGAILLVSVAGTSSRGVARAVRELKRQGIAVIGALVTTPDGARPVDAEDRQAQESRESQERPRRPGGTRDARSRESAEAAGSPRTSRRAESRESRGGERDQGDRGDTVSAGFPFFSEPTPTAETGTPRTAGPLPDRAVPDRAGTDRASTNRPLPDRAATDRAGTDRTVTGRAATGQAVTGRAVTGLAVSTAPVNASSAGERRVFPP